MPHALSPTDIEMAAVVVQELGVDGHYSDDVIGEIELRVQWVGGYNEVGTDGQGRPWESMCMAYISAADVATPRQGALIWINDDARYMLERFAPTGGLWELELFPE